MRSFDCPKPVDAVTCLYASLNHLSGPDELRMTFRCAAMHLRPGGTFIFDLNTRAAFEALWRSPGTDLGPGLRIEREYIWEDRGPWVSMHMCIERQRGHTVEFGRATLRARWFDDADVRGALASEGLAVEDVISFNPFSEVDRDEIKQLWTTVRGPDT